MHNNKKKMDHYSIPVTPTHKSQFLTILNASQDTHAAELKTIVTGATDHMIMDTTQINNFITIINASSAQNKTELVNVVDPNGPTPPIKL